MFACDVLLKLKVEIKNIFHLATRSNQRPFNLSSSNNKNSAVSSIIESGQNFRLSVKFIMYVFLKYALKCRFSVGDKMIFFKFVNLTYCMHRYSAIPKSHILYSPLLIYAE